MDIAKPSQYVEIIEQPASSITRFRYKCEYRLNPVYGINTTLENKTFPSIRIIGYTGPAKIIVSCVTKDEPYRPHPYNLVGGMRCKRGIYTIELSSENMVATFAHFSIECVKRDEIKESLRTRQKLCIDPFQTGFSHIDDISGIDLTGLRLCFQVFLKEGETGKFNIPLQPVVSNVIFDGRIVSYPTIYELSHSNASVAGGTKMILLCDKVMKNDVQIRFIEQKNGEVVWEGFGDFGPDDIYKQTAIVFKTPAYSMQEVTQPVQVYVQLKRPSDGAISKPLPFLLTPPNVGIARIGLPRPRKKIWSPQISRE